MQLPALLVSDIHLTDNHVDDYRWALFPQLKELVREHGVKTVAFLGDTTDAKDYHSATLVNRIVRNLAELRSTCEDVVVLMGNHDYLKEGTPYLEFMNFIPGIRYVTKPMDDLVEDGDGAPCLWLPHTRNPMADWASIKDVSWFNFIFMHQTVSGSRTSNGQQMEGDGADTAFLHWSGNLPALWSGDIHVPQTVQVSGGTKLHYVGSPYHVHFGDSFEPRAAVLITKGGRTRDLAMQFPSRFAAHVNGIAGLKQLKVHAGDQVKVCITLTQADAHDWPKIRAAAAAWAERSEVVLADLRMTVNTAGRRRLGVIGPARQRSPQEALLQYVQHEELGAQAYEAGLEILE